MCKIRFWQFRDCGGRIFPRFVAKIRSELKLINVDFVLGGQRKRKYNSDFRQVQISFSVSFVLKLLRMQFFTWYHKSFACSCEMWSAGQLLFLWQIGSRYTILEMCKFQFWHCRDCSCHIFLLILAISRLHLIDPSSIEHNSACYCS